MNSSTWKLAERQVAGIFGGKRVPLSGSNSGHNTSADVMGIDLNIYVEVKRDLRYSNFFEPYMTELRKGTRGIFHSSSFTNTLDLSFRFIDPDGCIWKNAYGFYAAKKKDNCVLKLYRKTAMQADKEGRAITVLVFRVHGYRGFVMLYNEDHFEGLQKLLQNVRSRRTSR